MRTIKVTFGVIWGFIISQILFFLLMLLVFLFLPLPLFLSYWIYAISFILGTVFFFFVKEFFNRPNILIGILSILILFLSVALIPELGRQLGDKLEDLRSSMSLPIHILR